MRNEKLRLEQEKIYSEAKRLMEQELLLRGTNPLLRNTTTNTGCRFGRATCCSGLSSCCRNDNEINSNYFSTSSTYNGENFSAMNDAEYLKNLEQTINLRAQTMAKKYLAGLSETERLDSKLSHQKVFLVLKFSETPDEVLLQGMRLMGDSE